MVGGEGLTEEQIKRYAYKGGVAIEEFEPVKMPKPISTKLDIPTTQITGVPTFKTQDLDRLLTRTLTGLRLRVKLETGLEEKQKQRQRLRLREEVRLEDVLRQRVRERLREKQRQRLRLRLRQITVTTPPPIIPKLKKGVPPPPIVLGKQKLKLKKLLKQRKQKKEDIFAFVEGFTARALALQPEVIKQENIKKLIKQIRTPFRIPRRPVIVK
jgi:hypothetical protein